MKRWLLALVFALLSAPAWATLPSSGTITFNQVADEISVSHTNFSITSTAARTLAGIPSGAISLHDFYGKSSFSADVTPTFGFGSDPSNTHSTVTTNLVVAAGHGGSGSYTCAWVRKSGDTTTSATNPSGCSSAFSSSSMASNSERDSVFTVTVSDGTSSLPIDVSVTLLRGTP